MLREVLPGSSRLMLHSGALIVRYTSSLLLVIGAPKSTSVVDGCGKGLVAPFVPSTSSLWVVARGVDVRPTTWVLSICAPHRAQMSIGVKTC